MTRENWWAVGGAVALAVFISLFGSGSTVVEMPENPGFLLLPATTTDANPLAASPAAVPAAPTTTPAEKPTEPSDTTEADLARSLGSLRRALVNIICVAKDTPLRSVSATGVIFDSRGLILTNAHIAQYLVLEDVLPDGAIECVIRTGSPARPAYDARVAYISSTWLNDNPRTLVTAAPKGTGKNDIAVLAISKSLTDSVLPVSFNFVPISKDEPFLSQDVSIGSYGAQTLTTAQIVSTLYPTLVFGSILDQFTFETTTFDLMSLGGSAVAQHGSSGGGVVNTRGELIGLITTSSTEGTLFSRDLRAVTSAHVRRSFRTDMSADFDTYFSSRTLSALVEGFAGRSTALGEDLRNEIGL